MSFTAGIPLRHGVEQDVYRDGRIGALLEILELRVERRDGLLEHLTMSRSSRPAEVSVGALAGELESAPVFASGALLGRSGGAGGLSPPRGFFLLGFH
jgi:hypothetical protein